MKTSKKNIKSILILTAIMQAFNGLSGIVGGFGLLGDPSGAALNMQLEWLASTPFSDFLIPGIVLFSINGLGNLAGFILSLRRHSKAGELAAFLGLIMMVWIISQVAWIGYKNFLQPLYFGTGLLQMMLGLVYTIKYKRQTSTAQ